MVQKHRKLAGYGYHGTFSGILGCAPSDLQPLAPEVRVFSEGAEDVVGAAYQKSPQHLVALSRDALLGITLPRLVLGGDQTQVSSYRAALFEASWVLQSEHEAQSRKRPYSLHLPQELGLRIVLFGELLKFAVVDVEGATSRNRVGAPRGEWV